MNLDDLNLITFIVTLLAFYLAYFQWFTINRQKRLHVLKVLKVQLDCLGPWVGTESDGYETELTKEQKFDNANPFKVIYTTGSSPLIDSTLLEQMSDVKEEIIGEISQLYYDFKRIETIQEYRNQLTSNGIKMSLEVREALDSFNQSENTFEEFLKKLNEPEKQFVEILERYGKVLHCVVIGNKSHGARQHLEKIYKWLDNELVVYKKPQYVFIVVTLVVFLLVLIFLNLRFQFTNLAVIVLVTLILTSIASFYTKAINMNNENV